MKIVNALGQAVTKEYDGLLRLVKETYPEGNGLAYTYDGRNNVTGVTVRGKSGSGTLATVFEYEPNFNKASSITDPLGRTVSLSYDSRGNLTEIRQPAVDGTVPTTTLAYDSRGLLLSKTAPDGLLTTYAYTGTTGDLASLTVDAGRLGLGTAYAYDENGNIISITDPLGHTTTLAYDDMRNLVRSVSPEPFHLTTDFRYDEMGRPAGVTKAGPPVWTTAATYNANGGQTSFVSPEGHATVSEYDHLNRLVREIDPEGRTVQYVYDAVGRLQKVIDGNGRAERTYTYTPNGKVASIKDANDNVTVYEYDDYDRLVSTAYPDGSAEMLTLDAAGRLTAVKTRGGQTIQFGLDELDRLVQKAIPGGGIYNYTYDLAGRVVTATGPGGAIQHAYDTAGRLLNVSYPGEQQVGYEYDPASRRTKLTYPDGSYATYNYDELGRLTAVNYDENAPGEEPALAEAANYGYDALSRRSRLGYGNGTAVDYAYNLNGNVTTLNHQWTADGAVMNYTYDKTGLQTAYSSSDDRFAPIFEALGTRTNAPNSLNQYVTAAGLNLTYDGNGNLTGDGTRTFSYDAANRLIAAQTSHTVSYAYDPFDRRQAKTVDGQVANYIYDGNQIIAEYDGSGLVRKYVYGSGIDEPIMMEAGEAKYYYHANTLGSTMSLTDSTGNVAETYRYSVYGQVDQIGTVGNPYFFTGREFDSETGLYYYRARYYKAELRRFLQPDPIGYRSGMNLYEYVSNNPVNYKDPFGLYWEYHQATGELWWVDSATGDRLYVTDEGYAGHGDGVNNPDMQDVRDTGPLPQGIYDIGDMEDRPWSVGRGALPLTPREENVMFGRSDFLVHGDNRYHNRTASEGCIILPRPMRNLIDNSDDRELRVFR